MKFLEIHTLYSVGGEGGIRTHGRLLTYISFRDWYFKPTQTTLHIITLNIFDISTICSSYLLFSIIRLFYLLYYKLYVYKQKNGLNAVFHFGAEGGIRTHGRLLTYGNFQDCCHKPTRPPLHITVTFSCNSIYINIFKVYCQVYFFPNCKFENLILYYFTQSYL